jgi:hypothetical protein
MKMEQCVPKRRHRKLRRLGITRKKEYITHNMANVGYQGQIFLLQKTVTLL